MTQDRPGLSGALGRARARLAQGQVVLVACFGLIAALALLEFAAPHVTRHTVQSPRPYLPVLGGARLEGAMPQTTYLSGEKPNTLVGVSAGRDALVVRTWSLAAALGRTVSTRTVPTIGPSSTVTLASRTGVVAVTDWGPRRIPALLVARSVRSGTRIDVLALTDASRPLAVGISAARIGTSTSVVPADWDGHGVDLVFVTRDGGGRTRLSVYAGPLGTGRRVASIALPYPFSSADWSLAIQPSAQRPDLAWITRDRSGSGMTELHMVLAQQDYQRFSEQVATTLPDNHPELRFALGLGARGQLQLYVIDPVLRAVGILSLTPVH